MKSRLRSRLTASLLVLPALALGLSACGGGDNDENVDKILDEAFTSTIKTANMTLDTEIKTEGTDSISGPIKLKISGPYKDNGGIKLPSFDWDVSIGGAGVNFSGGLISSGDNVFVSYQDQDYEVGEDTIKQINDAGAEAQKQQGGEGSLKSLGVDARSWVKNGKDEGTEEVAGVETTHISAELDVPKMIDDLNKLVEKSGDQLGTLGTTPEPLTDDQKKEIDDIVGDPKFDVYVGKEDRVLRRLSTDVGFEVPEDDRDSLDGLEGGDISFSIQFADVGDSVEIKPPTGARPLSQLLNQILPGLGLGTDLGTDSGGSGLVAPGSTDSTGGTTTPPTSTASAAETREKLRKFQDCVERANPSDNEARAKCLDLLK